MRCAVLQLVFWWYTTWSVVLGSYDSEQGREISAEASSSPFIPPLWWGIWFIKLFSNTEQPFNYNNIIIMHPLRIYFACFSVFKRWSVVTSAADSSWLSSWIFCCCWTRSSWTEARVCCSWVTAGTRVETLSRRRDNFVWTPQNPTFSFWTR